MIQYLSSTKENFVCFVHFVRRTVWSINPFVVINQHERKTFTDVMYDVQIQQNAKKQYYIIARDQNLRPQREVRGEYF